MNRVPRVGVGIGIGIEPDCDCEPDSEPDSDPEPDPDRGSGVTGWSPLLHMPGEDFLDQRIGVPLFKGKNS